MRYVRKWNRFKELILILNASLREIEDRWADGKGPLANEYTPDEVKRLIKKLHREYFLCLHQVEMISLTVFI